MNTTTVSGIKLKVSISRNQPIEFGDKGVTAWNAIGKCTYISIILILVLKYLKLLITFLLLCIFNYKMSNKV